MADYEAFTKAYEELERWTEEPSLPPALKRDAERLARAWENNSGEEELKNEIVNRFAKSLAVREGTIRHLTGAGLNRMNIFTVRRAAQALADLLKEDPARFGGKASGASDPTVAVGYDARPDADRFALEAAAVLIASGFRVRLAPKPVPVPFFSFAVTYYGAVCGMMITGGRSPANYSGVKFYDARGAILSAEDSLLLNDRSAAIDPFADVRLIPADDPAFVSAAGKDGLPLVAPIEPPARDAYRNDVLRAVPAPKYKDINAVLSTMNGTGNPSAFDLFRLYGIERLTAVPDQEKPDGSFTSCPTPDPERPEALRKALALAEQLRDPDIVLAFSPDCDCLGIAVKDLDPKEGKGSYVALSGAQTAALLLDYLCVARGNRSGLVFLRCDTASTMPDSVANYYGIETVTCGTGSRALADALDILRAEGRSASLVLAFDGMSGFCVSPSLLERDAVATALLAVEMAGFHKSAGRGVLDRLAGLEAEYGYYRERELEFRVDRSVTQELPLDLVDEEGVRIYVRKSRTDGKIRVNLSLRKDSDEEASRAINAAEYSVRGKVKEWFPSTKR